MRRRRVAEDRVSLSARQQSKVEESPRYPVGSQLPGRDWWLTPRAVVALSAHPPSPAAEVLASSHRTQHCGLLNCSVWLGCWVCLPSYTGNLSRVGGLFPISRYLRDSDAQRGWPASPR